MWFFCQLCSLKLHYCKIVANRQASGRKPEKAFNWENDPIVHAKLLWQPCKLVQMMMAPSRLHSSGFAKFGPTTHKKLIEKYSNLSNHYHYLWRLLSSRHQASQANSRQIGKKIQEEKFSTFFLFQSILMAIQKGNAVYMCVLWVAQK